MACGTQPKTPNEALQEAVEEKPAEVKNAADTQNVSVLKEEAYDEIFIDVKVFIENLNAVIQSKNYVKWRDTLSEERLREISSKEFLERMSETPSMKRLKRVLKKPEDYLYYVVVPSRANSKVDKIEILDNNIVRAIYFYTRTTENGEEITEPLLVYELAKTRDSWTIIR
jgi:hypothetical protein